MKNPIQPSIQPYLMFGGRCDEAIAFYSTALGAQVEMIMRFDESPDPPPPDMVPPGWEKKVMHSSLRIGAGVVMLMQPFFLWAFTWSFLVTLVGTVMFIITSHFPE